MSFKNQLHELFYYSMDGVLYNRFTRNPRALKAHSVGSLHHSGYLQTQIDGKLYMVHRLIWIMKHGDIPKDIEVDHINHDRCDNRIENLRLVTRRENNKNRSLSKTANTSGVVGVHWITRLKRWGSQIKVDGQSVWLGSFVEFSDAVNARKNAEVLYGFHENHGKD